MSKTPVGHSNDAKPDSTYAPVFYYSLWSNNLFLFVSEVKNKISFYGKLDPKYFDFS